MNKLLLLVFTSLLTLLVIACTASSNSQASDPSVGTYLGRAGYSRVYEIKTDRARCVLVERISNSPAISCVVR